VPAGLRLIEIGHLTDLVGVATAGAKAARPKGVNKEAETK
jgi:hypothetical protein